MSQLFNLSLPDLGRHRIAAVALLPVVLPTVYVAYLNWAVRRRTSSTSGRLPPSSTAAASVPRRPQSLPEDVLARPQDWVVSYERVISRPVPAASLVAKLLRRGGGGGTDETSPSPLLTAYLRTTYKAFSWTPQAFLIHGMLAEPERKASFGAAHIDGLRFARGDVVDGVYRVTSYEVGAKSSSSSSSKDKAVVEVVELSIDVPRSYKGPAVRGIVVSAMESLVGDGEDAVQFVNETWLWRKKDEKPTLLESGLGQWFHRLLAGWLVMKGLGGVTRK
ncbi:uncharacterized protein BBA_07989 [Beauveria bassiana ARSEF 2860]|uniref:Uncharacterized protein n=1 Tax=Beauveria bassiana (strain ARSEF 2860) TaxID=655819 RepID=J5J9P5_BEAB2|nr:uncharacterized protein BBA_07989 [Beauveria bassiana ARSEF 2860]EJP62978.1 hypothetical protein BBA_07989 [Beauveria bassiana ARSEF 2860]